jgi:hypothetical protein
MGLKERQAVQPEDELLESLVRQLDSITDGDLAMAALIRRGPSAVPALETFLIAGKPRSIALPRCRAARALGALGAREALLAYFAAYILPQDAVVAFAEDAVRSAVAEELLRWRTEEVYTRLVTAAQQRSTLGLISAIGQFRDPRSLELLFFVLEDDICRSEAMLALRLLPTEAGRFALKTLRGETAVPVTRASSHRRLRAVLSLLSELDVPANQWHVIEPFLNHDEPGIVLTAISIGCQHASPELLESLLRRAFHLADKFSWYEESIAIDLCDAHKAEAVAAANDAVAERFSKGQSVKWTSPAWRILDHVLDRRLSHPVESNPIDQRTQHEKKQ